MKTLRYLLIVLVLLSPQLLAQTASKGTWHIVLIGATQDNRPKGIGPGVRAALNMDRQNFTQLAQALELTPVFHEIRDGDLSGDAVRQKVVQLINEPKPGTGKFMLTLVSHTHGFNAQNATTAIPYMLCEPSGNTLNSTSDVVSVGDMYDLLRTQSQFDHVQVFAELCNNIAVQNTPSLPNIMGSYAMKGSGSIQNLEALFYGAKAVLMTSSVYGQYSFMSPNGGWFGNALYEAVQDVFDGKTGTSFEQDFFPNVIARTEARGKAWNQIQTPQGYVDDIPANVPVARNNDLNPQTQPGSPKLQLVSTPPSKVLDSHRTNINQKRKVPRLTTDPNQTKATW